MESNLETTFYNEKDEENKFKPNNIDINKLYYDNIRLCNRLDVVEMQLENIKKQLKKR